MEVNSISISYKLVVLLHYRVIVVLFAGEKNLKLVHFWRSYRQNGLIAYDGQQLLFIVVILKRE